MNIPESNSQEILGKPRGRPRVDDKRRRVLDAALRVFADRGYHGTAVPQVAAVAGVGTGTIYRNFRNKEELVNEVYRDTKGRLGRAMNDGIELERDPELLFLELWQRVVGFARNEPLAFQFLEMQDHVPYLDAESRALEIRVLAPAFVVGKALAKRGKKLPVEAMIALSWGALVGLLKAERLGYLTVSDSTLEQAGRACWAAITLSETTS